MSSPPPSDAVLKLKITRYPAEHCVLVRCYGRLVAGHTQPLTAAVAEMLPAAKRIILDLSGLQHTDSMGLGALVRLYVSCKSAGCALELTHLSKQIRNLLGMTNLLDVFTVLGEHGGRIL